MNPQENNLSPDGRLEAFFKNYLTEEGRRRPLDATRLGDHRFDHLLDDVSPPARKAHLDATRKTLTDLDRTIPLQS